MARPRFQISLRFILFMVMPYVAIASAILAWAGPYDKPLLNRHARICALIVLTSVFVNVRIVLKYRKLDREMRQKELS